MNLKELRGTKKRKEVAGEIGITTTYYGMIENGERNPSLNTAMKLAEYFKVPVETLFVETIEK